MDLLLFSFVFATSCETAKTFQPTDYEMRLAIIKLRIYIYTQWLSKIGRILQKDNNRFNKWPKRRVVCVK